MIHLIHYYFAYYLRSYRYFPPVATYLIFIIVFYTYRPNPAIDSYTVTATALYYIIAWLSLGFFAIEHSVQQQLTLIHSKSYLRNFFAKIATLFLIAMGLTLFSFLYPIVFNLLDEPLTIKVALFSLLHHLIVALLGIALASLFQRDLVKSVITSIGGLTLVLVGSLVYIAFTPFIPKQADFLFYLFPPAYKMVEVLMKWNGNTLEWPLFLPFLQTTIYIGLLFFITYFLLQKKRRLL
jgi:hypothetical protein